MKPDHLQQYAVALGMTLLRSTFDAGQTWQFTTRSGDIVRFTYYWGDEFEFYHKVSNWLDAQPWPREDDPRVATQEVPS